MSETFKNQIDLAAEYQKQHSDNNNHGILHDLKEGVKEIVEIVKGNDNETHSETQPGAQCPNKTTLENVKTFNSDHGLRNETFGASV